MVKFFGSTLAKEIEAGTSPLLNGYREADLRLCFRICKKPVFLRRGSNRSISKVTRDSLTQFLVTNMLNERLDITYSIMF